MSGSTRRRPSSPRPSWLLLIAALASGGCVSSPAVRAAEQGRYDGLRASMLADFVAGKLGLSDAVDFAKAVAKSEVARAQGEPGVERIRELRSCANEISGALGDRAETTDRVGAEAAMALVDAGIQSPGRYAQWALVAPGAEGAAFRPLGARSLVSRDDAALRRRLMADPDEDVRRNALRAALAAADPADVEPVLEAARVDPSPPAREQAIRTAGALGGERVVVALKDLWPRADASTREAIVDAWRRERSFSAGGRRELEWAVGAEKGPAAILAAAFLTRAGGAGGAGAAEAAGVLERAIKDGPSEDRVRAVDLSPLGIASIRQAVRAAEGDPDEGVAAAAMVRRLEASAANGGATEGSPEREALVAKLLPLAAGTGPGAVTARGGLSRARVRPLVGILEKDADAKDPKRRAEAGTGLAVIGQVARAALFASDPEPSVRTTVACAILRDWTRR